MAITARGKRLDLLKEAEGVLDSLNVAKVLADEGKDKTIDHVRELLHVDPAVARQVVRSTMGCLRRER